MCMAHICVKSGICHCGSKWVESQSKAGIKPLCWCSHQEDHVRDRVLLRTVCDESRAGAGQLERRPGQSSWEPGLWVHRRPHSPTHRTPVEHYQVTPSNIVLHRHGLSATRTHRYLTSMEVHSLDKLGTPAVLMGRKYVDGRLEKTCNN